MARYMVAATSFEQVQDLLKKGGKKIERHLDFGQSGILQAGCKPILPFAQYGYSVKSYIGKKIGFHRYIMCEGQTAGFAYLV